MAERFATPRANLITSSAGFEVEVTGRTGIRYSEADRTVLVDSEILAPPGTMALYRGSIRAWQPPHASEEITDSERTRIVENIRRAFVFKGHDLQII